MSIEAFLITLSVVMAINALIFLYSYFKFHNETYENELMKRVSIQYNEQFESSITAYMTDYFIIKYKHIEHWEKDFGKMYRAAKKVGNLKLCEEMIEIEEIFNHFDIVQKNYHWVEREEFYEIANERNDQIMDNTGLYELWKKFAPDYFTYGGP